jgi:hypothetical protein
MSQLRSAQFLRVESGVLRQPYRSLPRRHPLIADSAQFRPHGKNGLNQRRFRSSPCSFAVCDGYSHFTTQPHNRTIHRHQGFREESTDSRLHHDRRSKEAIEKSRLSHPRDQGSRDHPESKRTPANRRNRLGRSCEPGPLGADASELHSKNHDS